MVTLVWFIPVMNFVHMIISETLHLTLVAFSQVQIFSIVRRDAVKHFGIYCQYISYKFYHQDNSYCG